MRGWILLAALLATPATARPRNCRQIAVSGACDRHGPDHVQDYGMFAATKQGAH